MDGLFRARHQIERLMQEATKAVEEQVLGATDLHRDVASLVALYGREGCFRVQVSDNSGSAVSNLSVQGGKMACHVRDYRHHECSVHLVRALPQQTRTKIAPVHAVWFVEFLRDGSLLVYQTHVYTVRCEIYDPDGALAGSWTEHPLRSYHLAEAHGIFVSRTGVEVLVFIDSAGIVTVDVRTGHLLSRVSYVSRLELFRFLPVSEDLIFVREGQGLVNGVYSCASNRFVAEWKSARPLGDTPYVVLPNGVLRSFSLPCRAGRVRDYDLYTGKVLCERHVPVTCGVPEEWHDQDKCGGFLFVRHLEQATDKSTGTVYTVDADDGYRVLALSSHF